MKKMVKLIIVVSLLLIGYMVYSRVFNTYSWEPTCSAPKMFEVYTHWFYVKYGKDKAVTTSKDFYEGGIDWAWPHEAGEVRNEIPTGVQIVYAALQERKIYKADIDFTSDELRIIRDHFNRGYNACQKKDTYGIFCVCILPGGNLKFILCGVERQRNIVLDFDYKAEETYEADEDIMMGLNHSPGRGMRNWKDREQFFDFMTNEGCCYMELDSIRKQFGEQTYLQSKYYREKSIPMNIWNRYFERFNYKTVISFENDSTSMVFDMCMYTNAESYTRMYGKNDDNYIENPARIKKTRFEWEVDGHRYETVCYFNEEEVLRVFDEAFGDDHNQKGELKIDVSKYNNLLTIHLNVGDKSILLEKTQIDIVEVDKNTGDRTPIYENYEGPDHQIFIAM